MQIRAAVLTWGLPHFSGPILEAPFESLQRHLYRLGIEQIDPVQAEEGEGPLEAGVRAAMERAPLLCIAAADGERWRDRLDPLRRLMTKVSRKRLTLAGKNGVGLLPGGTEVLIDSKGEIPLFLLPFSQPDSSVPTLLIVTPGGEAVLRRLHGKIEKTILKVFSLRTQGQWVRMCGVGAGEIKRWAEQASFEAEVELKCFPAPAGIDLLVRSSHTTAIRNTIATIEERWGKFCYRWEEESLEEVVGKLLLQQKRWLAIAESCTGGRIAARITRIPGSSRYFDSACVAYSYQSKERLLGVPKTLLQKKGAVSAEVAAAMAEGIRRSEGVDLGLSVTGIAGPGGGTSKKPVGQVYIALSDGREMLSERFQFHGDRETIQTEAAQMALEKVRRYLLRNAE